MGVPRAIVAQMWTGSRVIRRLTETDPDPSPEELDAIARDLLAKNSKRQDGVLPRVRVLARRGVRRGEP